MDTGTGDDIKTIGQVYHLKNDMTLIINQSEICKRKKGNITAN